MSRALTVIDPTTTKVRPPPRRAAIVFGASTVLGGLTAELLPNLAGLSVALAFGSGLLLLAWLEQWLFRRLLRRKPLRRLLLSALVPFIGLFLWVPALVGAAVLGSTNYLLPLMATAIAGGMWFASAAGGSFVVVLIDTVVSAIVFDFRRRVQIAVLMLASMAGGVSVAVYGLISTITEAVVGASRGQAPEGVRINAELARNLEEMGVENASTMVAAVSLTVVAAFLLPAILSACGKLADSVMERLLPLDEGFSRVTDGDLALEVEEGGSREMRRITAGFNRMVRSLSDTLSSLDERNRELMATNFATSRFVPFAFLELLHKRSIVEVSRGDQVQLDVTVMFTDIRGFTTLAESMGPERTFAFINRYLERMEPTISREGGVIAAFLGDGIMALFPRGAEAGVRAAVAMAEALRELNRELEAEGSAALAIGIGLQSGSLMLGTIGGRDRLSHTVVGDSANVAARVEGMTKLYRAQILIGEGTFERLGEGTFALREVDRVRAVGKTEAMRVFEVLDGLAPDVRALREEHGGAFSDALQCYRRGAFREAARRFASIAAADPTDGVAALHVERCSTLFEREGDPSWDGVSQLERK